MGGTAGSMTDWCLQQVAFLGSCGNAVLLLGYCGAPEVAPCPDVSVRVGRFDRTGCCLVTEGWGRARVLCLVQNMQAHARPMR